MRCEEGYLLSDQDFQSLIQKESTSVEAIRSSADYAFGTKDAS